MYICFLEILTKHLFIWTFFSFLIDFLKQKTYNIFNIISISLYHTTFTNEEGTKTHLDVLNKYLDSSYHSCHCCKQ